MSRIDALVHEFVEFIPKEPTEGVVYVSVEYKTAVHLCCCGCRNKTVTPLSPTDWRLTFDGETVSLYPSIGNWSFPCQSHYWIDRGRVDWAPRWSRDQIEAGRARDRAAKARHYGDPLEELSEATPDVVSRSGLWSRLSRWLSRS